MVFAHGKVRREGFASRFQLVSTEVGATYNTGRFSSCSVLRCWRKASNWIVLPRPMSSAGRPGPAVQKGSHPAPVPGRASAGRRTRPEPAVDPALLVVLLETA